jgi:transaldolase
MKNRIRQITGQGQAVWIDFISRELVRSGKLREFVNEGVTGVTSNPTIFQKSISVGTDYDAQLREMVRAGCSTMSAYEGLALQDICEAADVLRPVYNETHARDGYVSFEVSPRLAADTAGTVAEARRLHAAVNRPNLMIKVPATPEGIPAIETLIGEGINVNVTLIFSVSVYEKVMQAYLGGLQKLRQQGRPVGLVASVASFFVSRVDTLIDARLDKMIGEGRGELATLRGQAAIANTKIAYTRFKSVFEAPSFGELKTLGARVQRPLWASTSTKNPNYPDTKYVDGLIGPHTVNTMPPQTLDAARSHANAMRTIDVEVDQAFDTFRRLEGAGIHIEQVASELLADGVRQFADSFEKLIGELDAKRRKFGGPDEHA